MVLQVRAWFFQCSYPVPCGILDGILDLVAVLRADLNGSRILHTGFLLTQFCCNIVSQQQRFALAEVLLAGVVIHKSHIFGEDNILKSLEKVTAINSVFTSHLPSFNFQLGTGGKVLITRNIPPLYFL